MNIFYKSIGIVLGLIAGLQAMEVEGEGTGTKSESKQEQRRALTPTEKEVVDKMLVMKFCLEDGENVDKLICPVADIQYQIGWKLHELYLHENPVLKGELAYWDMVRGTMTFKIRDLLKGGSLDLSSKEIFGNSAGKLLITLDPEIFFHVNEKSSRLLILIAPYSLIEDKIETTASEFKWIMEGWDAMKAPIGIFYRMERWKDLSRFDCLTSSSLEEISSKNLYKHWSTASDWPIATNLPIFIDIKLTVQSFMFILT